MAMSKGVAIGNIVIGCGLLVLTLISIICGALAMSKLTSPAAVSIGLWGIYFAIPGVLSTIAGFRKLPSVLGVALGTHIFGIILAIGGMSFAATFWAILDSTCLEIFDHCVCYRAGLSRRNRYYTDGAIYKASCDDLKIVRNATGAVTIIFAFCGIVTFVGSIYGCIGTCCAPTDQNVVIATGVPAHTNTVVVTSTQQQPQAYSMQPPQAYGMEPPQAYGMQPPQAYGMQSPSCNQPGAVGQGQVFDTKH